MSRFPTKMGIKDTVHHEEPYGPRKRLYLLQPSLAEAILCRMTC
jgi:hypothetical protein